MNWAFPLTISLLLCLVTIDALPAQNKQDSTEAFKPDLYKNYLTCLALCGKRHTIKVNRTLLSGEIMTDFERDEKVFDTCDEFCQERERYSIALNKESIPSKEFERLEVTCLKLDPIEPLRIHAKLHIQMKESVSSNATLLYVVETWRSFADEGGIIKNTLVDRHFTFSTYFMVPYTFVNPNQENLLIRVFAYTPQGSFGKPLCSGPIMSKSLFSFHQKPLTLSFKPPGFASNSTQFLQWASVETTNPPECEQVLEITMIENTKTKNLVLDSSHQLPLGILNENFKYKIKLSGFHAHQHNSNTASASILVIDSLHVESEDWTQSLISISGLLIIIPILILLTIVCTVYCWCCQKHRKSRASKSFKTDIYPASGNNKFPRSHPSSVTASPSNDTDTRTQETHVFEEYSVDENRNKGVTIDSAYQQKINECIGTRFITPVRTYPAKSKACFNMNQNSSLSNATLAATSTPKSIINGKVQATPHYFGSPIQEDHI